MRQLTPSLDQGGGLVFWTVCILPKKEKGTWGLPVSQNREYLRFLFVFMGVSAVPENFLVYCRLYSMIRA